MKSRTVSKLFCLTAVLWLAPQGFAKHKQPMPVDPRFTAIDHIVTLPIVDNRAGKKEGVNLESLRKATVKNLKRKNYAVVESDEVGAVGAISEEDLNNAKESWIRRVGPADARWVMIVALDQVHSRIVFGSTANVEIVGYLYDKQDGALLWKGTGVGQAGQGGLAGMTMKTWMKGLALDSALANLLSGIPKRQK